MGENRAYQRLRKLYPPPRTHWQRLESWTGAGIFDINGCSLGREIWVECKEGILRKRDNVVVTKVRPAQIAWQYLREAAGGRTYIALVVKTDMFILPGNLIKALGEGMTIASCWSNSIQPELLFH